MIASRDKKTGAEKFLFDQNCFDDDYEEEIVAEEPPPPTFSEQELEAARKEGYARGHKDGLAEAAASREKQVAALLETIGGNLKTLFDAEMERDARYEAEAVAVARAVFARLFPDLNRKHGLAEVEAIIAKVLQGQREAPEIVIEVHSDFAAPVQERLDTLAQGIPAGCKITVSGKPGLGPGDCRMRWDNGGAGRDAAFLAEEIHRQLEHMLADRPTLLDNGDDAQNTPPPDSAGARQDAGQTITEKSDE